MHSVFGRPAQQLFCRCFQSLQVVLVPTLTICASRVRLLGNTPAIALKHYLQVTDDDLNLATQGGAKCGAVVAPDTPDDPRLRAIINAWATLPESVREAILAMATV